MRRFWVEPECIRGPLVDIEGESFNHMVRVCRLKVGDKAELLFGGNLALCIKIIEVKKKSLVAMVESERPLPVPVEPYIHLGLCLPKIKVLEKVLEKATELGVFSVQLLESEYGSSQTAQGLRGSKLDRWLKIVKSATEQSGRGHLMEVKAPKPLGDHLEEINRSPDNLCLMCYEGEAPQGLKETLTAAKGSKPVSIHCIVGAEGGFSAQEVAMAQNLGVPAVTLGPQIMRVETACVSILSILKYEFEQMVL